MHILKCLPAHALCDNYWHILCAWERNGGYRMLCMSREAQVQLLALPCRLVGQVLNVVSEFVVEANLSHLSPKKFNFETLVVRRDSVIFFLIIIFIFQVILFFLVVFYKYYTTLSLDEVVQVLVEQESPPSEACSNELYKIRVLKASNGTGDRQFGSVELKSEPDKFSWSLVLCKWESIVVAFFLN